MSIYDNESRLQFARDYAERLADDMRRSRRLTRDQAGLRSRASLRGLLHRDRATKRTIPAYHA